MASDYQLTLKDYALMLRRRAVLVGSVFVLLVLLAAAVVVAIPPVYRSTGTILVESQQIPLDIGPATANTFVDERIQIIQQRVMTRENIARIIDRYGLFQGGRHSVSRSEMLDEVRTRIEVEPIGVNLGGRRRNTSTIAFKVSFEHRSPDLAYRVANELVTLFLEENARARTRRAEETTEFLTQEAEKLKAQLEALEAEVAAYKQEHRHALPEHLELHMGMLQRTEAALKDVEREYKSVQEELRFLDLELVAARAGRAGGRAGGSATDAQPSLTQLKAEYARLSTTYTANHPDVRALLRRIERLEAEAPAASGSGAEPAETGETGETAQLDLAVAKVQAKISAANARLTSLASQREAMRTQVAALERRILQTPQVERGLVTLMRDHENARRKYEEVRAKQVDARILESLEEDKKAERFSLLEPPLRPDRPHRPDRPKLLALGFVFAAGSASGLALLLELLKPRVRGTAALTHLMRQPPLVVLPYITTRDEIRRRRIRLMLLILAGLVLALLAAVAVHFLYKPLDVLFFKVIARLG